MIVDIPSANAMSRGASPTAEYVRRLADEQRAWMHVPFSYGLQRQRAFNELAEIYGECSSKGWDGNAAVPVDPRTYLAAWEFIEALPSHVPQPSLGVDPDGDVTFEWYAAPRRAVSVSISPNRELHFAALLGSRRYNGREPFFGDVPGGLISHISDVLAA